MRAGKGSEKKGEGVWRGEPKIVYGTFWKRKRELERGLNPGKNGLGN